MFQSIKHFLHVPLIDTKMICGQFFKDLPDFQIGDAYFAVITVNDFFNGGHTGIDQKSPHGGFIQRFVPGHGEIHQYIYTAFPDQSFVSAFKCFSLRLKSFSDNAVFAGIYPVGIQPLLCHITGYGPRIIHFCLAKPVAIVHGFNLLRKSHVMGMQKLSYFLFSESKAVFVCSVPDSAYDQIIQTGKDIFFGYPLNARKNCFFQIGISFEGSCQDAL